MRDSFISSFRGTGDAREPGIQMHARHLVLDSGSPLRGVRNDKVSE